MSEQEVCKGVKWTDVTSPSKSEMEELASRYNLNAYTVRDCMQPEHLPKYKLVDDVHFLILRFNALQANGQRPTIQELTNKIAIFTQKDF